MAHALNPSTLKTEAGGSLESESRLLYRESSRTTRAIQRDPVCEGMVKGHSLLKRLIMLIPEGGISHLAHTAPLYGGSDSKC